MRLLSLLVITLAASGCLQGEPCSTNAECDDGQGCTVDGCGENGRCLHLLAPVGITCRAAAGECDVAETCDGQSTSCPGDFFKASTVVCRAGTGTCDAPETCSGNSAECPADAVAPAGTTCRPAAPGLSCDAPEKCDGTTGACPADTFATAGTVCRSAAGACDNAETCNGSSPTCPADQFKSAATTCRAANGACDVAERCSGAAAQCPDDVFLPKGVTCRAAVGTCDLAETCSGSSSSCPFDVAAAATTVCGAAPDKCHKEPTCGSNFVCMPAQDRDCTQGNVCLTASCHPLVGCMAELNEDAFKRVIVNGTADAGAVSVRVIDTGVQGSFPATYHLCAGDGGTGCMMEIDNSQSLIGMPTFAGATGEISGTIAVRLNNAIIDVSLAGLPSVGKASITGDRSCPGSNASPFADISVVLRATDLDGGTGQVAVDISSLSVDLALAFCEPAGTALSVTSNTVKDTLVSTLRGALIENLEDQLCQRQLNGTCPTGFSAVRKVCVNSANHTCPMAGELQTPASMFGCLRQN